MPENRVTLARDGNVIISYTPSNEEPEGAPVPQAEGRCSRIWACITTTCCRITPTSRTRSPSAGCAHQAGTCRFGLDPSSSVLNADCRAHEVDNLYVVDTSFFPSIGAVNPALTAMANALRVGDHLLERIGASQPQTETAHVT